MPDKYADFVDHPRYGRRPNITGLNPNPRDCHVHLHWNATTHNEIVAQFESVTGQEWPYGDLRSYSSRTRRIPDTAIPADLARQTLATVPVTHYFDLERRCRDCDRPFIFFAREQKYWYEELDFGLESDCVRCVECRKRQQGIAREREVYETLFHIPNKTVEQLLQMAAACLSLIESGIFTAKQTERVRMLLKAVPDDADVRGRSRYADLLDRVLAAERKSSEPRSPN
ncbi:MAG: zinc-ribbon domain containing protein [Pirellulaceae bacterium]